MCLCRLSLTQIDVTESVFSVAIGKSGNFEERKTVKEKPYRLFFVWCLRLSFNKPLNYE